MIYAILDNKAGDSGTVVNVAISDKPLNDGWVDITDADPKPAKFWTYDGSTFAFGEAPKDIAFANFIDQFTDDEYELYLDVDTYDKKETKPEKSKVVKVKRSRNKLARKKSYPKAEFMALSQTFVDEGILTQARYDEIIAAITGLGVEDGLLDGLGVL